MFGLQSVRTINVEWFNPESQVTSYVSMFSSFCSDSNTIFGHSKVLLGSDSQ